jgi:hypothetical protein
MLSVILYDEVQSLTYNDTGKTVKPESLCGRRRVLPLIRLGIHHNYAQQKTCLGKSSNYRQFGRLVTKMDDKYLEQRVNIKFVFKLYKKNKNVLSIVAYGENFISRACVHMVQTVFQRKRKI